MRMMAPDIPLSKHFFWMHASVYIYIKMCVFGCMQVFLLLSWTLSRLQHFVFVFINFPERANIFTKRCKIRRIRTHKTSESSLVFYIVRLSFYGFDLSWSSGIYVFLWDGWIVWLMWWLFIQNESIRHAHGLPHHNHYLLFWTFLNWKSEQIYLQHLFIVDIWKLIIIRVLINSSYFVFWSSFLFHIKIISL